MYDIKILYLVKELRKEPLFLTLTQATNFRQSHTIRVCRRQFQIDENSRKFSRIENTVGKGEIAPYEQLLLSQCFKRLKLQTRNNQGLFGKGLTVLLKLVV